MSEPTFEAKYKLLLTFLSEGATRIDHQADGNYTAITTRFMLDGNLLPAFREGSPHSLFPKLVDAKLEAWLKLHRPAVVPA